MSRGSVIKKQKSIASTAKGRGLIDQLEYRRKGGSLNLTFVSLFDCYLKADVCFRDFEKYLDAFIQTPLTIKMNTSASIFSANAIGSYRSMQLVCLFH